MMTMKQFIIVCLMAIIGTIQCSAQSTRDNPGHQVIVLHMFGSFEDAVSMSCVSTGDIFVLDQKNSDIYKINKNGNTIKEFGGKGWGDYEFDDPTDITSSFLLEVFVTDRNNLRVQQYDRSLNYVQSFSKSLISDRDIRLRPKATAVSSQGNIFILDTEGNRVLKLNSRQKIEKIFGSYSDGKGKLLSPVDISIMPDNTVTVLDGSEIKLFDYFGNYIKSIPLPHDQQWCAVSSYGKYIIAVSHSAIMIFTADSQPVLSIIPSDLVTDVKPLEFRDAGITHSLLYILTPTTILQCSLNN